MKIKGYEVPQVRSPVELVSGRIYKNIHSGLVCLGVTNISWLTTVYLVNLSNGLGINHYDLNEWDDVTDTYTLVELIHFKEGE